MKRVGAFFLILSALTSKAQYDSLGYYFKQLKKQDIGDSTRVYFNIRIGDYYIERNPGHATPFSRIAYRLSEKISSTSLLYSSSKNLSASFSGLGNYDSCLYYAKQSLDYARTLKSPEFIFSALNLLGNAYIKKEQLANAKMSFDEALQLMGSNTEISHKSRVYLNLGNYYLASLNFKKSVEILKQGELIAIKEKEQDDLMRIYSSIGQSYAFTGKADSGLHYQLIALDYFVKNNKKREKAIALLRMGVAYGLASNTAKMEEYHDQAYGQYSLMGDNVSAINVLMGKVNFYFRAFQFAKCLKVLNKVEPRAAQYNLKEPIALSFIYRAGIFAIMKDTTRAVKYQQLAEELSKELKFTSFERMNGMIKAVVLSTRWKSEKGDSLVTKALLSVKNEIPDNMLESSLQSIALSKDFLKENKEDFISTYKVFAPDDSLEAGKYFDSLISRPIDSNLNIITGRQLLDLEAKYQNRLIKDRLRIQDQLISFKNKSIQTRNYLLAGLVLLVFAILILFARSYQQQQKIKAQLEKIYQLQTELTHRTGNFFDSIKGMLSIAQTTTSDKPTILSLSARVNTIQQLYKSLYSSPAAGSMGFSSFLESICSNFQHSFGDAKNIQIYVRSDAEISNDEAIPLAYIVTELLTNAEKYAFEGRENGDVNVAVYNENGNRILYVRDNGNGSIEGNERKGSSGMNIIKSYVKTLGGTMQSWNDNGYHIKIKF